MFAPLSSANVERERREAKASVAATAGWENEGGAAAPPRVETSLIARWLARIATFKLGRAEPVAEPEVAVSEAVSPPERET